MRNTYLQFAQLISGVFIAILLGIHMVIMHLDKILNFFGANIHNVTSWESMKERATQQMWVIIYIALLIFGLYHALNGLRGVLLELTTSVKVERIITGLIIFFGVVFLVLGIYAPLALISSFS